MSNSTKLILTLAAAGVVFAGLGLMPALGALTEPCLEGTDYERSRCSPWNPALVVGIGLIVVSLSAFAVRIWRRTTAGDPRGIARFSCRTSPQLRTGARVRKCGSGQEE